MEDLKLTKEEELILKSIVEARSIQDYLWNRINQAYATKFNKNLFVSLFQKRVDKISEIDINNHHAKVELKKRLLQQAALSILALRVIDEAEKLV